MSMKEAALNYVKFGFSIFPLHYPVEGGGCSCGNKDCPHIGKHPMTKHGVKDASKDPEQVAQWWDGCPEANIGIATGNGLVVIDVDGEPGHESLSELLNEFGVAELPETWAVLTGRTNGIHFYFHCSDPTIGNKGPGRKGIDVRGNGGYVVAPPSLHKLGTRYQWELFHSPDDTALAELPDWLRALLAQPARPENRATSTGTRVQEGNRNEAMFKLASSLRGRQGLSETAIIAAVQAENLARCDPPLDEKEVITLCRSASRYEPGDELSQKNKPTIKLTTISARDLQEKDIPPAVYIVERLLTAGLAMIAAKPKMGKSWMVLDLCLAVSAGLPFLGYQTNQGGCLYLALEDTERRLKSRMNKLLQGQRAPEGFYFTTSAHDIENGLIEELEAHVAERPQTKLIVIDTLQKVRPPAIGREGAYAADYKAMTPLKAFADKHTLCILLVHHLRKMGDDGDPFNRISGTNGIMGALDTSIVLDREERAAEDTTFSATGRDIESQDKIIRFDKEMCRWKMQGDADWLSEQRARLEYQDNPIVKTIKKLLDQSPDGQWSGNMSDLMNAGRYIARANLAPTNRKLTSEVHKLEPLLLDYDGITHSRTKKGSSGGSKHYFSSCNTTGYTGLNGVCSGHQTELYTPYTPLDPVSTVCNGTVYETDEPTPFDGQEEEYEHFTE